MVKVDLKMPGSRLCTFRLAKECGLSGRQTSLGELAKDLLDKEQPKPHRADTDARLTAELFLKLMDLKAEKALKAEASADKSIHGDFLLPGNSCCFSGNSWWTGDSFCLPVPRSRLPSIRLAMEAQCPVHQHWPGSLQLRFPHQQPCLGQGDGFENYLLKWDGCCNWLLRGMVSSSAFVSDAVSTIYFERRGCS